MRKNILIILSIIVLLSIVIFALNHQEVKLVRKITVIALGDSLTEGSGVLPEDSYPSQLQNKLFDDGFDVEVVNKGISGDTSADVLNRLDEVLEIEPDIVILAIGSNDGLRGIDPGTTKNNIIEIIKKMK